MNLTQIENSVFHQNGELESGWTFWENYRQSDKHASQKGVGDKNWENNCAEIISFNDQNKFSLFWNNSKYDDSSNLIFSSLDDTEKKLEREGKMYTIDGLNMFREGIKPAWEDPKNANGYHLQCEFPTHSENPDTKKIYKNLWEDFVFGLIAEDAEYSECITGLRYVYKPGKSQIRVELWISESLPDEKNTLVKGNPIANITDQKFKINKSLEKWMLSKIRIVLTGNDKFKIQEMDHKGKK